MDELKALCVEVGASDVTTYIQSGNIILKSDQSPNETSEAIASSIKTKLGYDISAVGITKERLVAITDSFPFRVTDESKSFVVFFQSTGSLYTFTDTDPDQVMHNKEAVYIDYPNGVSGARISLKQIERCAGLDRSNRPQPAHRQESDRSISLIQVLSFLSHWSHLLYPTLCLTPPRFLFSPQEASRLRS